VTGIADNIDQDPTSTIAGRLDRRRVILAVTGGIAAYKSCHLVREIIRAGGEVQVLMTDAATRFVAPLTFATLSGKEVLTEMFPEPPPADPIHLTPARWGHILVVAPATANFIGRLAGGLADDLPSTVALAFQGPILLAPAMNPRLWTSPAVQDNIEQLSRRGVNFIGPEEGEMGGVHEEPGPGRMSEPDSILNRIEGLLADRSRWQDRTVLVTSGPTIEPLDPVRFLSNRSSGRMGDAVARQAILRGAEVILIRGKAVAAPPPDGVELVEVETAAEMSAAVKAHFDRCDLLVMAAAVADWTPESPHASKLKKIDGIPELTLCQTEDILAWAGSHRSRQAIVGFALETDDHLEKAGLKLASKGADLIALNDPTRPHSAFGGETVRLTLVPRDGEPEELPTLTKREAADRLLEAAQRFLSAQ